MKINNEIELNEVFLIDVDGVNLGKVSLKEALRKAEEYDLDLVLVSEETCRMFNYEKFLYSKSKEKKVKPISNKEIKFTLGIAEADFNLKIKKILELNVKYSVTVKVIVVGRQKEEMGMNFMKKILGILWAGEKEISSSGKVLSVYFNVGEIKWLDMNIL